MTDVAERGDSHPIDDGEAIHYSAVSRGTPVYSADGVQIGLVREVLDNYREHIFDGVVFEDGRGTLRFADAPEVSRTAERGVTLALSAEDAGRLPPPEKGQGSFVPNLGTGRMGRIFRRGWKRR
jgi:hypothetical protein